MKKSLAFLLALVSAISLFGCSRQINTITDFSRFADMTRDTERIDVTFDNHTGAPFCFTIEDQAEIEKIMDIIFSASFVKMKQEVNGGSNTSINIVQGDRVYSMGVIRNYEGKIGYTFTTTELQDEITKLAREAGAFDGVE